MIFNTVDSKTAGLAGRSQQIGATLTEAGLSGVIDWTWPLDTGGVKGYPSIITGRPVWQSKTSLNTHGLPAKPSALPALSVAFDLKTTSDGIYNTAFDLWIVDRAAATYANITAEIMVWVNRSGMQLDAKILVGRVVIGADEYDFYAKPSSANPGMYFAFVRVINVESGTVNLNPFLDYLLKGGYITPENYLNDIEFGNEVVSGTGRTVINNYRVNG